MVLCLLSCDYESDKEYFKEVAPPTDAGVTVDLKDAGDTVMIGSSTQFTYTTERGSRRLVRTMVYMDEKLVSDAISENSLFYLTSSSYAEGFHTLRIEITTNSGNGSLADALGYEQAKISRAWVAVVDKTPPQKLGISAIAREDGILVIHWPRYKPFNFRSYLLTKEYKNGSFTYTWSREITDKDQTSFSDSTFQGGMARYTLRIKADNNAYGDNTTTDYTDPYTLAPTFEWVDQQHVKLTWRMTPFYKSFSGYSVEKYTYPSSPAARTNNLTDTTMIVEPGIAFPVQQGFLVSVITALGTPEGGVFANVSLGTTFPQFNGTDIAYNKVLNKYFALRTDADHITHLLKIDGTSLAIEQSTLFSVDEFCISNNGQYLYAVDNNVLQRLSPVDLTVLDTYDLNDLYPSYYRFNDNLQVTDNNLLVIDTDGGQYLLYMADFAVMKQTTNTQRVRISASGNHLLFEGNVYQWDGTQYTLKGPAASGNGYFRDDTQLMLMSKAQIVIFDLASMLPVSAIPYSDNFASFCYDRESDLMGSFEEPSDARTYTTYSLYSPLEGKKIKSFQVGGPQVHYSQYIVLLNNHLICSTGYILPLSHYYP